MDQRKNPADVLKPDILAPGNQIWAAWSPMSAQNPILSGIFEKKNSRFLKFFKPLETNAKFSGHSFALISGTSMATPHIAGIAALIKETNLAWTPSMIASAMSTTAIKHDNQGEPIMAEGFAPYTLYPAAPFGFGAGLVDPIRALDPGLVFATGNILLQHIDLGHLPLISLSVFVSVLINAIKQDLKATSVFCALFQTLIHQQLKSPLEAHVAKVLATRLT